MNEGHAALLSLELFQHLENIEKVRDQCVFTTHTPIPAGHDVFDIKVVEKILDEENFKLLPYSYTENSELNMTNLAMEFSGFINGVAKKHAEVSREMFPKYDIKAITNGVHALSWVSPAFSELYDAQVPEWKKDPTKLNEFECGDCVPLWDAHFKNKKRIIDYANATTNVGFDYDFFTIGWARRITSYKRPVFLLADIARLEEIANKMGPLQIIYGGKAHPQDKDGKKLIEKIISISKTLKGNLKITYLENYDMYLAKLMTSGVDVWLNTPLPPREASGTSGMKCALNGVPQLSVLDGWWHEGFVEGKTGWKFSTTDELYSLLENEVMKLFYNDRKKWADIMQNTIAINGSYFNAHRMIKEYIELAYKS